jgi:hypothetical protein
MIEATGKSSSTAQSLINDAREFTFRAFDAFDSVSGATESQERILAVGWGAAINACVFVDRLGQYVEATKREAA